MVIVKTHEEYTVHYVTSRKYSQSSKDKTYTLKPVGDTYVITAIAVTAGNLEVYDEIKHDKMDACWPCPFEPRRLWPTEGIEELNAKRACFQ